MADAGTLTGKKYRHEYKYLCDSTKQTVLKMRAKGLLKSDPYAGEKGYYKVRSLYFDTPEDSCYYENESGIGEREKYRIRIYNADGRQIYLEKKSKSRQMCCKTSCPISEKTCLGLMSGKIEILPDMSAKEKELLLQMRQRSMRPVVVVEYLRYPFLEKNGNVRITFDENICSSNDISRFLEKEMTVRPILPAGRNLMEVKWDEFLLSYIKEHMELEQLQWSNFSKYYLCRKYNIYGGVRV